jgi:hypothetical protein
MTPSSKPSCRKSFTRWQGTSNPLPTGVEAGSGHAVRSPREETVEEMTEYQFRSNHGVATWRILEFVRLSPTRRMILRGAARF